MPQSKRTRSKRVQREETILKEGHFSQFGIDFLKRILEINLEIASMDRNSKGMVSVS